MTCAGCKVRPKEKLHVAIYDHGFACGQLVAFEKGLVAFEILAYHHKGLDYASNTPT
jgi:hypothetical protein